MESQAKPTITRTLAHQVDLGADAVQVAATISRTWHRIDEALCPVLGESGVAALYKRSVYLSGREHPWLLGGADSSASVEYVALESVLSARSAREAADAGGATLERFIELLTKLVGPSLTERLLRTSLGALFEGTITQDPLP